MIKMFDITTAQFLESDFLGKSVPATGDASDRTVVDVGHSIVSNGASK